MIPNTPDGQRTSHTHPPLTLPQPAISSTPQWLVDYPHTLPEPTILNIPQWLVDSSHTHPPLTLPEPASPTPPTGQWSSPTSCLVVVLPNQGVMTSLSLELWLAAILKWGKRENQLYLWDKRQNTHSLVLQEFNCLISHFIRRNHV